MRKGTPGSRYLSVALVIVFLELVIWNFYPTVFRTGMDEASRLLQDAREFARTHATYAGQWLGAKEGAGATKNDAIQWFIGREELTPAKTASLHLVGSTKDNVKTTVRLEHWETKMPVVILTLQSRQPMEIQVPFGEYRMVFSQIGNWWWGDGFRRLTRESVTPLVFSRDVHGTLGHEVRFDVVNGNMATRPTTTRVHAR